MLPLKSLIYRNKINNALEEIGNSLNHPNYITSNGSYIKPNGVIVLSEKDTELYLAGLLDFSKIGLTH